MGITYPKYLDISLGYGFNALYGISTNYGYYRKENKGEHGLNPFKGMQW